MAAPSTVTLRTALQIPASVLAAYEEEAKARGSSLESLISSRLQAAVNFTSTKPLYLTDSDRSRLERLLRRNFTSPHQLIEAIEALITVSVGDVEVPLSPTLLQRLKSRCFGKTLEQFVVERTLIGLEEFTGMR